MKFRKYQHIEKLNTRETNGIENGLCYIFPKIDGTNGSIWSDGGEIKAGSRNRELTLDYDNAGFYEWVLKQENIKKFFENNPDCTLYGEWLVPHTLKTYREESWRKFYVFDIIKENGNYIPYEEYISTLTIFNIDFIPALCKINNPDISRLPELLEKNKYLIKDNAGIGEGIVIKNYDYKNRFGRITWAKIVANEFKDNHSKNTSFGVTEILQKSEIEEKIVNKFITESLIEKEYSKIITEENGWSSKYIQRLFGVIWYCLIKEEMWNILKEFGNQKIDFKRLNHLTVQKIKQVKIDLF